MSYDIWLKDPDTNEILETDEPHMMRGGTYCVGGTNQLSLNITYNYADYYYDTISHEDGIRYLYGKTGAESIPILKAAIEKLKGKPSKDYWKPCPGNAKKALRQLLALAQMRPDGVWDGD